MSEFQARFLSLVLFEDLKGNVIRQSVAICERQARRYAENQREGSTQRNYEDSWDLRHNNHTQNDMGIYHL